VYVYVDGRNPNLVPWRPGNRTVQLKTGQVLRGVDFQLGVELPESSPHRTPPTPAAPSAGKASKAEPAPRPAQQETVTRVYDVRDLIAPREDAAGVRRERATRADLLEAVIDLIKRETAPDSWAVGSVRELNGQLIIAQTLEGHAAIARVLRDMREARSVFVLVDARFMTVSAKADAELRRLLKMPESRQGPASRVFLVQARTDALVRTAQRYPTTRTLTAPRVKLLNGQDARIDVESDEQVTLPVVGAPGRQVKVPYPRGTRISFLVTVPADRESVNLTLDPSLAELIRAAGRLEESTAALGRVTVTVPKGQTVVFRLPYTRSLLAGVREVVDPKTGEKSLQLVRKPVGPAAGPERFLYVTVKPRIVIQKESEEPSPPAASEPATKPAGKDLSTVTYDVRDALVEAPAPEPSEMGFHAPRQKRPPPRPEPASTAAVANIIRAKVDPDSWPMDS